MPCKSLPALYLPPNFLFFFFIMPNKITPSSKAKRNFMIHAVVFIIAVIVMVLIHHKQGEHEWAYPWHAWIIAAWALALLGHFCVTFFDYEDKGLREFNDQTLNG